MFEKKVNPVLGRMERLHGLMWKIPG